MAHKSQLIDLVQVAEYVGESEGVEYSALVTWICETFECRERAAKDSLSILVKGGWAEARGGQSDGRSRTYHLTPGGHEDLATDIGRSAVRSARRRFSTCSRRARRVREHQERNGLIEYGQELWLEQQTAYRAFAASVQSI